MILWIQPISYLEIINKLILIKYNNKNLKHNQIYSDLKSQINKKIILFLKVLNLMTLLNLETKDSVKQ
jgi:hypothetical protein